MDFCLILSCIAILHYYTLDWIYEGCTVSYSTDIFFNSPLLLRVLPNTFAAAKDTKTDLFCH